MTRNKYRIVLTGLAVFLTVAGLAFVVLAQDDPAWPVEHIVLPTPEQTSTPEPIPVPTETPEPTPKPTPKQPWTKADVRILAKIVYAEANGQPVQEQAAVVWCVLNRLDTGLYGRTIRAVAMAPNQFAYRKDAPARKALIALVEDVLERWWRERLGETDVGRTLPPEYLYFAGRNGRNHFRTRWRGAKGYWNWSLPNPYG
ncbi:MAG: cell wall hydrolase [Clostridiales bacterium]|nr:cell wall hydrolase [Clostridiales bacterium]